MTSHPPYCYKGKLNIHTISEKLKLKSAYVKHIERSKKRLTNPWTQSSGVVDRFQNESLELFQMYLRAGMEDRIQSFLEQQGLDILKTKFLLYINLRVTRWEIATYTKTGITDDSGTQQIPAVPIEGINSVLEDSNIQTNNEITICDGSSNFEGNYNTKVHLNAIQLAILVQQGAAVECILKCILRGEAEEDYKSRILLDIIESKVEIENVSNISSERNQVVMDYMCLQDMNVFHLSCQFFPKALEILAEVLCEHSGRYSVTALERFAYHLKEVVKKKNSSGYTPLHIAAKKSLVVSAR